MSWPLPRVDVERSPCTSKLGAALPLSTESGPSWHPTVAGDVQSKWVWRALSGLYHLREWTSRLITATARSKLYLARLKCIVKSLVGETSAQVLLMRAENQDKSRTRHELVRHLPAETNTNPRTSQTHRAVEHERIPLMCAIVCRVLTLR